MAASSATVIRERRPPLVDIEASWGSKDKRADRPVSRRTRQFVRPTYMEFSRSPSRRSHRIAAHHDSAANQHSNSNNVAFMQVRGSKADHRGKVIAPSRRVSRGGSGNRRRATY